jgi:hypothetical protein
MIFSGQKGEIFAFPSEGIGEELKKVKTAFCINGDLVWIYLGNQVDKASGVRRG